MRLLVSVADAADVRAAIAGGADVIDAKDPTQGPLGAVSEPELRAIASEVAGVRPVSVALGDIDGDVGPAMGRFAVAASAVGAGFLKLGFAAGVDAARAHSYASRLMADAVPADLPGRCQWVFAAYADVGPDQVDRYVVLEIAARCGAVGVLLDTREKRGRGLFGVLSTPDVAAWVRAARGAGLMVVLAGSLGARDLVAAREVGADMVGVRGAACEGGRGGRVSVSRVRALVAALGASTGDFSSADAGVSVASGSRPGPVGWR
jgi:uncharacterized protein (UPF0264 family)